MNNNKLLNTINVMVDYFILNLLWVIASIPLITIFPATAAMFGVIRKRHLQKETNGIFIDFFSMFKENFKQSFVISIIWTIMAVFLYFDYLLLNQQQSFVSLILFIVLIIGIVLFSANTIYLFPIMVHFELTWKLVIRNAFFFSLMNPVLTVILLLNMAFGIVCFYGFPASVFIVTSPLAYIIYYLCQNSFNLVIDNR